MKSKLILLSIAAILLIGLSIGSLTWAILASQGPSPPDLQDLDWWENTIVYQIYPRSFKDSDGDGIGDLKGITSEMQHFVDTGAGAIWMSPIFSSPMVDFGYDISDFYDIHYEYGTMADFEEYKSAIGFCANHVSTESEYFIKSVNKEPGYEDYFVWADPLQDPDNSSNRLVPSNWISEFGGTVWEWNDQRQQYYLHQFAIEQADLNFRNPAVRQELLNILRFWFYKGVDGFRLDALPHMFETPPDENGRYPDEPLSGNMFLRPDQVGYTTQIHVKDLLETYDVVYEWRQFADQWQQETGTDTKILLAEAYANITMTMLYYGDEQGRIGAHFPFNFDFITDLDDKSNARHFVYTIQKWLTYMPSGKTANWVFGNHDQNRMPSRFRTNMVDGLNALNLMLPGVAVTYQAEEIGQRDGYVSWEDTVDIRACNQGTPEDYIQYSRDPARTPFQWDSSISGGFSTSNNTWLPVGDYMEINLQAQKEAERSHYKVYQARSRLRSEPALSHGTYSIQALSQNTLILIRSLLTHDTYALVFNVANESDTVDLSDAQLLAEPVTVYTSSVQSSGVAGDSISLGPLTLQPGEALALKSAPHTS